MLQKQQCNSEASKATQSEGPPLVFCSLFPQEWWAYASLAPPYGSTHDS